MRIIIFIAIVIIVVLMIGVPYLIRRAERQRHQLMLAKLDALDMMSRDIVSSDIAVLRTGRGSKPSKLFPHGAVGATGRSSPGPIGTPLDPFFPWIGVDMAVEHHHHHNHPSDPAPAPFEPGGGDSGGGGASGSWDSDCDSSSTSSDSGSCSSDSGSSGGGD